VLGWMASTYRICLCIDDGMVMVICGGDENLGRNDQRKFQVGFGGPRKKVRPVCGRGRREIT